MDEDVIPTNISLKRCTVKKTKQILKKIVLYTAYVVVACAAIFCITYPIYTNLPTIISLSTDLITYVGGGWDSIATWFSNIGVYYNKLPEWLHILIIIISLVIAFIISIIIYSFAWCLNRELTEEDKKHDEYHNNYVDVLDLIMILVPTIVVAYIVCCSAYAWGYNGLTTDMFGHQTEKHHNGTVAGVFGAMVGGMLGFMVGLLIAIYINNLALTLCYYRDRKRKERETLTSDDQKS